MEKDPISFIIVNTEFRSDYTYSIDDGVICIIDLDKGTNSVTYDIENVLADISIEEGHSLSQMPIIYRDSQGLWDAVQGWPGVIKFFPLSIRDKKEAIDKYLNYLKANN